MACPYAPASNISVKMYKKPEIDVNVHHITGVCFFIKTRAILNIVITYHYGVEATSHNKQANVNTRET